MYLTVMKSSNKSYSAEELTNLLNGNLIGKTDQSIDRPEQLELADHNCITFIGAKKYLHLWEESKAPIAIVDKSLQLEDPGRNRAFIEVDNADLAMADLLDHLASPPTEIPIGIHPSAVVDPTASVGEHVKIGANVFIGANVQIGSGTVIYPNVTLLDEASVGQHCVIKSGCVIAERCTIGHFSILQANVSIGADGFGYRPTADGRGIRKITHIGNVVIGNYVEIGASTCIDRGKFSATSIGDATKIDNLVQIGHNCRIGQGCLIAGCCGISGSVTIGNGVIIGGQVAIKDHVTIGNGVTVGGKSGIIHDVPNGKTVLGFPAMEAKDTLKQWALLRRVIKKGLSF